MDKKEIDMKALYQSLVQADKSMRDLEKSVNNIQDAMQPKEAHRKYTPQKEADSEEKSRRASELKTQGRKGCKAPRINLSFTPENFEFIKIMSKASGLGMAKFVNEIIGQYKNENEEVYDAIKALVSMMNSDND